MAKPLTDAQVRKLIELAEPNKNVRSTWYFPQKDLRTLRVLAFKGFARAEDYDMNRYGFSITPRGYDELHRLGWVRLEAKSG